MTTRILPEAVGDALLAARWYESRCRGLGDRFLVQFDHAWRSIGLAPQSFPRHEQYSGPRDVRRCSLGKFPYQVVFVCLPSDTVVLAVAHLHQDPLYWGSRLP